MLHRSSLVAASLALPSLLGGCSFINAPDEVRPGEGSGGSGGSGGAGSTSSMSSSSASSSSASSSTTTTTTTTATSSSDASSSSTGTMMVCSPGQSESCYDGPAGTQGVGICASGTRTCDPSGNWGPCVGQVQPAQENCDTFLVDEDCNGAPKNGCPTRVLFVSAAGASETQDMVNKVNSTGAFAAVNSFDAQSGTPSLAQLMAYDVVLVSSNYGLSDPVALGNVVADYYDNGGRVVLTAFVTTTAVPIQGRFGDPAQGYLLLNQFDADGAFEPLGAVPEPQSPLMNGVAQVTTQFRSNSEPINGGVVVARYSGGPPLIVRGVIKGRNRADLNCFPLLSYCSGNCTELLRNALLFQ